MNMQQLLMVRVDIDNHLKYPKIVLQLKKQSNLHINYKRQGKTKLSQKQIKRIAFILVTDLKNFAESNGNFSNLSANAVYSHLQSNQ